MVRLFWCPQTENFQCFWNYLKGGPKFPTQISERKMCLPICDLHQFQGLLQFWCVSKEMPRKVIPFFWTHSTRMNRSIWILPGINESSIQMLSAQFFQTAIFLPKYRRLQLPVHTRDKNMFCWPIKIQSFDNQTSKFTRPLGNVLAPLTRMIVADLSTVWQLKTWRLQQIRLAGISSKVFHCQAINETKW